jgi:hypothetical protein
MLLGFISETLGQYERKHNPVQNHLQASYIKLYKNQCSRTKVIVCDWANGQERANIRLSRRCEHAETMQDVLCFACCFSVASTWVLQKERAHGSSVVGTTGCT